MVRIKPAEPVLHHDVSESTMSGEIGYYPGRPMILGAMSEQGNRGKDEVGSTYM